MEATRVSFTGSHLVADLPGDHVVVDGCPVRISRREAEILALLLANHNRLVRREVLLALIWGFPTRALDVYIGRLRRKLGRAGVQLQTHHLMGYRFVEDGRP